MSNIAFIGAGNMARALLTGLVNSGYEPSKLCAADPDTQQREQLASLNIATFADNAEAIAGADAVVLAIKPQIMRQVLSGLTTLGADQLLISIAAGIPMAAMQQALGRQQPIVRCMPNTPALLGQGVTVLVANPQSSSPQRQLAEQVLRAAGKIHWLSEEADLDAVTAISGSGPAYFFYLMEAMISAGVALGLSAELARSLATETALGAARMAVEGDVSPAQLRKNVTSPGGTTERALSVLNLAGVAEALVQAMEQAAARSKELAEDFSKT